MNESLVFELSVDTVNLVKGLATAKNQLDQFAEVGKTSITQLNAALKALETQADKSVNPAEIAKLKEAYAEVKAEVARFRKEFRALKKDTDDSRDSFEKLNPRVREVPKNLQQVDDAARRSRIALYGVNQVVRDLPFGFIAISNNIPVVIDQFQALFADGKNVEKSFKALGQALIGAGGLSIAFSAGISVITSLIQEYGSLGAAINDIFNLIDKRVVAAAKQRDAFAEVQAQTGGEVSGIQQLISVIEDENRVRGEKINAYLQLKKEYPGIIQNLTEEQALTKQGTDLIKFRSLQIIQYIQLKGREQALIKLVADEEEKGLKAVNKLLQQVTGEGQTFVDQLIDASVNAAFNNPIKSLKETSKEVVNASKQTSVWSATLKGVRDEILQLDPVITGLQKLEKVDVKALDKKALDKKALDVLIASLIEQRDEVNKSRESFGLLSQDYLRSSIAIAQLDAQIKKLKTTSVAEKLKIDIELRANINQIKKDFESNLKKAGAIEFTPLLKADEGDFKKRVQSLFDPVQVNKFSEALKTAGQVFGNIKIIPSESVTKSIAEVQKIREEAFQTAKAFMEVLGPAIDTVFNAIENGENIFQAIGKSLKQLVLDLVKATVKAAAFALIITALTAGTGAPVPFGAAFKTGLQLQNGGIGGLFGGGGVATQGGGLSVGPGGLAIQGNVTFVQRGQDLVGVLSQSNARINRVG